METEKKFICHFEAIPQEKPEFCLEGVCCGIYDKPSITLRVIWVIVLVFIISPILYYAYRYYNTKNNEENEKGPPPGPEEIRAPLSRDERTPDNSNQKPKVKENVKQDNDKKKALEKDKMGGGKKADDNDRQQELYKDEKSDSRGGKRPDNKEKPQGILEISNRNNKENHHKEHKIRYDIENDPKISIILNFKSRSKKSKNKKSVDESSITTEDAQDDSLHKSVKRQSSFVNNDRVVNQTPLGVKNNGKTYSTNNLPKEHTKENKSISDDKPQPKMDEVISDNLKGETLNLNDTVKEGESVSSIFSIKNKNSGSETQYQSDIKNDSRTSSIDNVPREIDKEESRVGNDEFTPKTINSERDSSMINVSVKRKESSISRLSLGKARDSSGNQISINKIITNDGTSFADTLPKDPTEDGKQVSKEGQLKMNSVENHNYSKQDISKDNGRVKIRDSSKEDLGSRKSNISKCDKITSRKLTSYERLPSEEDQSDLGEDKSNMNSQQDSLSNYGNVVKKDSMTNELSLREKHGSSGHQNSIDSNNNKNYFIDDSIPKEDTMRGERDSNESAKAKVTDGNSNNSKPGSSRGSDSINKKEILENNRPLGTEKGGSDTQKSTDNKNLLKKIDSSLKATQDVNQASNESKPIADGGQNNNLDKDTSKNNRGLLMEEHLIDSDDSKSTVVENSKAVSPSNDPPKEPNKDEKRDNDDKPQPEMDLKRNISQETNSIDNSEDYLSLKSNVSIEEEIKDSENRNPTDIKNHDEISSTNNISKDLSKDKNTKKVLQSKIDNVQNYPLKRDSSKESESGKKRGSLIRKLSLGRERNNSKDSNKSPGKSVK